MRSAITVCLVPEARSGPFVFHAGLEHGCEQAAKLGFDAVEVFPRSPSEVDVQQLRQLLDRHGLKLAAVGTGAGWLTQQLSLTATEPSVAQRAAEFIRGVIELAGSFGAPAIIGSMQGRIPTAEQRDPLFAQLTLAIEMLAEHAERFEVPLLIEPLNRYETNVFTDMLTTASWIGALKTKNVRILADMFHMNIEEADMAASVRQFGHLIGHVHFADSNRRAIGLGHTDAGAVIQALKSVGYSGYLSAEVFPLPDAITAAQQTICSFRKHVS
ncbi:MAG: sugar phosphate isomerase/epimerase family protein [Pirellulaceae bacterium]|nr:sugar phosphate isomerase/epimerase family protein [Pirellulaceae bacterium]